MDFEQELMSGRIPERQVAPARIRFGQAPEQLRLLGLVVRDEAGEGASSR